MSAPRSNRCSPVTPARLTTAATVFVCTDCRRGPKLRRAWRRALAAAGRKREVRIVGCGCLNLCPKRGAATVVTRAGDPGRCAIVRDDVSAEAALAALLDEGVGDPVSD